MIDNQFYPTDRALAELAYRKFNSHYITRLLEPSAGRGDLLIPILEQRGRKTDIDCVEYDLDNQAVLRNKNLQVVATDFLTYRPAAIYSHVILNPPFNAGAKHVLHAWDIVSNAEIVAILNAETIRNPCSREREQLLKLIEDHAGSEVEFINAAFMNPDTQRKTTVEVALVHLVKKSASQFDAGFIDKLKEDRRKVFAGGNEFARDHSLMLPNQELVNRVIDFKCAVDAMIDSHQMAARYRYLAHRLGNALNASAEDKIDVRSIEADRDEAINESYTGLKASAWSGIIRSTSVTKYLSSGAARAVEEEFDHIRKLEFTLENIYSFIEGLMAQQGTIHAEMMCEVFDLFSRYHTGNRSFYRSWKSNDKHKTQAHRLKMSRFVIPGDAWSYQNRISPWFAWRDTEMFRDMDRAFACLDGKTEEGIYGIQNAMVNNLKELWNGERVSTDYFDIRFYLGAATFHLYPKRKDLVDRLNNVVGAHRMWLPHDPSQASPEFWQQYEQADKVNIKLLTKGIDMRALVHGRGDDGELARQQMDDALRLAQLSVGIDYQPEQLGYERDQLRLTA